MNSSLPFGPVTVLKIDLSWYVEVLLRHVRMILGAAGICLGLALFFVFLIVPQYTASSQILLDPRKQNVLGPEAISSEFVLDAASVDGQIAIIKSRSLLTRVIEDEKLASSPVLERNHHRRYCAIQILMPWAASSDNDSAALNPLPDEQENWRAARRAVGV